MKKIFNILIMLIIAILSIIIGLLWFLSGFPFRYLNEINIFSIVFDIMNIIYFIILFKISNKYGYVIVMWGVMLILIGYFFNPFIDPVGDCFELGGHWNKAQGCIVKVDEK